MTGTAVAVVLGRASELKRRVTREIKCGVISIVVLRLTHEQWFKLFLPRKSYIYLTLKVCL